MVHWTFEISVLWHLQTFVVKFQSRVKTRREFASDSSYQRSLYDPTFSGTRYVRFVNGAQVYFKNEMLILKRSSFGLVAVPKDERVDLFPSSTQHEKIESVQAQSGSLYLLSHTRVCETQLSWLILEKKSFPTLHLF